MIQLRPECHRGGSTSLKINIERSDEYGRHVWLNVIDEEDVSITVTLLPDEAHALAANLAHFADMADR